MANAPYVVRDHFLPPDLHRALLAHCLERDDFARGRVVVGGELTYHPDARKGMLSNDRLGPHLPAFLAALRAGFVELGPQLGIAQFDPNDIEIRLAAHGDGDYFKPHRDTFTGADRPPGGDRVITAVYYMHRLPRVFTGGDLLIHPFGGGEAAVVEPQNNRLVAFPSFAIHEVTPVQVPSGDFADSRFSVSCWFKKLSG